MYLGHIGQYYGPQLLCTLLACICLPTVQLFVLFQLGVRNGRFELMLVIVKCLHTNLYYSTECKTGLICLWMYGISLTWDCYDQSWELESCYICIIHFQCCFCDNAVNVPYFICAKTYNKPLRENLSEIFLSFFHHVNKRKILWLLWLHIFIKLGYVGIQCMQKLFIPHILFNY